MRFQEEILDERTLMVGKKVRPSGTMNMRGSEGAARRDVSRAGFRKKGPIQDPKVEKSGKDVPVWVRTHKSPGDYAAHTARKQHREGDKPQSKELKKQFGKTGAKKDSPVHDITVGSPKSKVKDPGQRARQFVGALKGAKDAVKSKKGVATNTPTSIDSAKSKGKKSRSGEEGAEQRGRIYSKLGMGERNPKTGVQMAKLSDSFNGKTFGEFIYECYTILEAKKHPIPDEEYKKWQKDREEGKGPASKEFDGVKYQMRGKGTDKKTGKRRWAVSTVADRKNQGSTRTKKERETQVSQDELRDTAKKQIDKPNPNERAAAAYDAEQTRMRRINKRVSKIGKNTGVKQSKDHIQPLQRKTSNPDNQERLDKVLPGHNSDNLAIKDLSKNSSKQNDAPKKGESGSTLTRASVKRKQLNRGDKLLDKVGREISSTQSGRGSRAARLLSYLRRDRTPRPDTGAARRMNAAGKKLNLPD
jgi:hypothetical protein